MLKVKVLLSRGAALLTQGSALNCQASEWGQLHGRTWMVGMILAPVRDCLPHLPHGPASLVRCSCLGLVSMVLCALSPVKNLLPAGLPSVDSTTPEMSHVFLLRGQHRERSFYKMGCPKLKKVLENDHITLGWEIH